MQRQDPLADLTLGKSSDYISQYTPDLLQSVPRSLNRDPLGITQQQPFTGVDIWNAYEISWLNDKGKPMVAMAEFEVPYDSVNLIESKSFKLYLNSFNQTRFADLQTVQQLMVKDLSKCAGKPVIVRLYPLSEVFDVKPLSGVCLDDLDVEISDYDLQTNHLCNQSEELVSEVVYSDLLKSNCLITNQPDWASVIIEYSGQKICHQGLLKYLISFRQHNEFHEQCVERIFMDITHHCAPEKLAVYARYTRRGGLDINPFRANFVTKIQNHRTNRQ